MAVGAFLRLTGETQGHIEGGVTLKGREGQIQVVSWSWGAERNFQGTTASGAPTASEFHITKRRDEATPLLLNAFANNEQMTEWRLELLDQLPNGAQTVSMRIDLLDARLASDRYGGTDFTSADTDHEELTFVYEQIKVTWLDGNRIGTLDS